MRRGRRLHMMCLALVAGRFAAEAEDDGRDSFMENHAARVYGGQS